MMKKGYLYIVLATILFSSMEIAMKIAASDFHSMQLTVSRFLIGGLFLLPFALQELAVKKKRDSSLFLSGGDLKTLAMLGFLCVVVSMTVYQLAVERTQASVAAVLFSSNPVFVMIFAYFILDEPIHKKNLVALVLDILGIVILINPWHNRWPMLGILLTLLSTLLFSLYGVLAKKTCQKLGGITVTCFSFLLGSLELLVLLFFTHQDGIATFLFNQGLREFANVPLFTGYRWDNLLPIFYIYIGVTGIGYAAYLKAIETTSANTAALVFFLKPIMAPILAWIILQETISWSMIVGISFILLGSMVSLIKKTVAHTQREGKEIHQ